MFMDVVMKYKIKKCIEYRQLQHMLAVCKIWFLFLMFSQLLSADTLMEKSL